jgi:hypothetical protein
MSITDDITDLANRTRAGLDNLSDFQHDTQLVWGVFKRWVREGHKLNSQNRFSGTKTNQSEVLQRFALYRRSTS